MTHEQRLGKTATFLLPSLKLKGRSPDGVLIEHRIHDFLMRQFGGYTAAAGNIFGYWKDEAGRDSYGEHRQYSVALLDDGKTPVLKAFLAEMARDLNEDCIYLEAAGEAVLVYRAG